MHYDIKPLAILSYCKHSTIHIANIVDKLARYMVVIAEIAAEVAAEVTAEVAAEVLAEVLLEE